MSGYAIIFEIIANRLSLIVRFQLLFSFQGTDIKEKAKCYHYIKFKISEYQSNIANGLGH